LHHLLRKSPHLKRCDRFLTTTQDEIDALAVSRSSTSSSDGSPSEGVLATLLNEMDGVQESLGVTVVAATNRPDVIVGQHFQRGFSD
jgi:ATP-dependent 26S proteasome regulatory subunit